MCNTSTKCGDHGTCGDDGKCVCYDGYYGTHCSSKIKLLWFRLNTAASSLIISCGLVSDWKFYEEKPNLASISCSLIVLE